ncbi:hypothetical protein BFW38_14875 [Terasakiispira papahanaumokuakeensis]|uniref:RmlD-like substrate binding domain-containing protein n=1 Tax=Terasakiispira papahanaumokuakeensis TaxID=197479 RepID=A0A1E2VC77_9GAMM|nr:sugar nucleotide-binding protein [Terasakiispira papahanaumokuakeensis]ODC04618.1 hypothetical protein BFW38_14875 [Terasakiispira papahanaumokuakeensis]
MHIGVLSEYPALVSALSQAAASDNTVQVSRVGPGDDWPEGLTHLMLAPLGPTQEVGMTTDHHGLEWWQPQLPELVAEAKARQVALVLLSSDQVLAPDQWGVDEHIEPVGETPVAQGLRQVEDAVGQSEHALILRVPPILSAHPNGGLARLVSACLSQPAPEAPVQGAHYRGLQSLDDVARVLLGMLQQLDCGAEAWGIYHYAGTEPVSHQEFMHTLAQQLDIKGYPGDPTDSGLMGLNCQHIMGTFGVHQRTWRAILPELLIQLGALNAQ